MDSTDLLDQQQAEAVERALSGDRRCIGKCGLWKPRSEFHASRKCVTCWQREYVRERRERNKRRRRRMAMGGGM